MLATDAAEEARRKLIEHNLRLVVYIAKKFDNTGVGVEDLISIGTIRSHQSNQHIQLQPHKNIKLATYASRCIENEILMYLRRNSQDQAARSSIDEPLNVDWDGNELLLSDILGTDEDVIYRDIGDGCGALAAHDSNCRTDRQGAHDHRIALRVEHGGEGRRKRRKRWRICWGFPSPTSRVSKKKSWDA